MPSEPVTESRRRNVAAVYDRVAAIYELCNAPMERMGAAAARQRLIPRARGRVLEVGIGTGRNLGYYRDDVELVGVDISSRMLERARRRAERPGRRVSLLEGDVERLPFPDASFDTVTATCVFCSVGDPLRGLREVRRVLAPTGRALLYEHVRPSSPLLGRMFDALSAITRRLWGGSVNRRTEQAIVTAGLTILEVRRRGIWREIVAAGPRPTAG